jgi:hypothetical protein
VDRYHLADGYHQVMLSTRELSPGAAGQAQTWVNQNLEFTHGFGLVMNFVSKSIGRRLPGVSDSERAAAILLRPERHAARHLLRRGDAGIADCFNRGKGVRLSARQSERLYQLSGKGGIPIDTLGKTLLFAWTQADINILLTGYLKPESRIQIWRNVQERVSQVAPFLKLDADPYARSQRRQTLLDTGCVHDFRSLPLFESTHIGRRRKRAELHSQLGEGDCRYV